MIWRGNKGRRGRLICRIVVLPNALLICGYREKIDFVFKAKWWSKHVGLVLCVWFLKENSSCLSVNLSIIVEIFCMKHSRKQKSRRESCLTRWPRNMNFLENATLKITRSLNTCLSSTDKIVFLYLVESFGFFSKIFI